MVVVTRTSKEPGRWRRRGALVGVPILAAVLFLAGAAAQRSGSLSGVAETLESALAKLRHPREVLDAALHGEALPELSIDVKALDWQKIEAKRDQALRRGILFTEGDDFVPATLRLRGERLRVKVRLKGDILDHLITSKWSLRIHLRGADRVRWHEGESGMRRFSIQHPKTRFYLHEWGFLETMRAEGLLAPHYGFARVVLNGSAKGIYAVEEAFARELMESQQRREGLLLALDEDPFHRWFHDLPEDQEGGVDVNPVSDRNVGVEPFDGGKVDASPTLTAEWAHARSLLRSFFLRGDVAASEVFDAGLLGRYFAICELWGASHPLRWGNVRFHYNPITDRIEPVAYDGSIATPGGSGPARLLALERSREGLPGTSWTRRALDDPAVAEAYVGTLARILSPEYVASLESRLGPRWRALATTLGGEFPGEPTLTDPWPRLRLRAAKLADALAPARHVLAFETAGADGTPSLEAASALVVPVRVVSLVANGREIPADVLLPGSLPDEAPVFRPIPLPEGATGPVTLVTRILGQSGSHRTEARSVPPPLPEGVPPDPTVEACLAAHGFLEAAEETRSLRVRPGTWDVEGDLVLPEGWSLEAGPGTTLRFTSGALLLARGPLLLRGSAEEPVVLAARETTWLGLAVLDAGAPSAWESVHVEGTTGVTRGGWTVTAGVTFYRSPVSLVRCAFRRHRGSDDQINVVRSRLDFVECELGDCSGDALDGDFVEGRLVDCSFHDVGGDAIDVSGSRLVVEGTRVARIGDKGISAGEASRVEATGFQADQVSIGAAAKDLSALTIRDSAIRGARVALAAYRKKPEYGAGSIDAERVEMADCAFPTVVQTGSWIVLDGRRIEGSDLDVKRLYQEGILGN